MSISLTKGQRLSLEQDTGESHDQIIVGLGWNVRKRKRLFAFLSRDEVDLDASVGLFDAQGNLIDQVWFQQLESQEGALRHLGVARHGAGDGDHERIEVHLERLSLTVQGLVFVVTSYSGETFEQVENTFCHMLDATQNRELARFSLTSKGPHTAVVMMSLYRQNDGWTLQAIGEVASGRTIKDLAPYLHHFL